MSILPLSDMTSQVIAMFSIDIPVQDVTYANVEGIDRLTNLRPRTIVGVVDASSRKQLEVMFGRGAVSDGDIGIYTEDKLYFSDIGQVKQSFINYNGSRYRVVADNDWTAQAGCIVYLARRHVAQETAF